MGGYVIVDGEQAQGRSLSGEFEASETAAGWAGVLVHDALEISASARGAAAFQGSKYVENEAQR